MNQRNVLKPTLDSAGYMLGCILQKEHSRLYIALKVTMAVVNAVFPLAYTVFPGLIINELTANGVTSRIALYVGLLAAAPVVSQLLTTVLGRRIAGLKNSLNRELMADFYIHKATMDYVTVENPRIQELSGRAGETMSEMLGIVDSLCAMLQALLSFLAITSIILLLNPLVVILIVLIVLANSLVTKWNREQLFKSRKEFSRHARENWALSYMMDSMDYAKEVRLFGIAGMLMEKVNAAQKGSDAISERNENRQNLVGLFHSATGMLQQVLIYSYLIYMVAVNGLAIGTMTIFLSAVNQFTGALSNVMNAYLKLSENNRKVKELAEFLSIPSMQSTSGHKEPVFDKESVLEFQDVSFKYPGSEAYALRHFNIRLTGDQKLCIVGENGSGKSTFVKLLVRLYDPTEGIITLNGVDIREYNYRKYQALFAPVFQDFAVYTLSLKENIVLAKPYDGRRFEKVCRDAGLSGMLAHLQKGADTQIGKEIDDSGVEPSGGEGQRMAIARACYHGGEIFLLDEPTAALDPNAEYEIYTQFHNMIASKCAVFVTHRLSAVQLSDKVAVFADGAVAEYGTHAELYAKGGIYTEMFDKQSEFYVKAKEEGEAPERLEN